MRHAPMRRRTGGMNASCMHSRHSIRPSIQRLCPPCNEIRLARLVCLLADRLVGQARAEHARAAAEDEEEDGEEGDAGRDERGADGQGDVLHVALQWWGWG